MNKTPRFLHFRVESIHGWSYFPQWKKINSEDTEEAATTDNYKTRYLYVDNNGEETELSEDEYKEQLSSYFQKNNIKVKGKTYADRKAFVRDLAIEYSNNQACGLSWYEVAYVGDMFYKLGKRYGLLKEFKENGIC